MSTFEEYRRELTKSGATFELCSSVVDGHELKNFANRPSNLVEVADSLSRYGDRTCMVFGDRRVSYQAFADDVFVLSTRLRKNFKVRKGDRVAILSANNPEWVLSFWAIVSSGAICTALNGWWKADEILFALQESGTKILIADCDRFKRIADRLNELPDLESVFLIKDDGCDQYFSNRHIHPFESLTRPVKQLLGPVEVGQDDDAVIIYTSGTTGTPKGAVITHQAWVVGLMNMAVTTEIALTMYPEIDNRPDPVVILCTLPFFHVAGAHGLVLGAIAGGATLVMPEGRYDTLDQMSLIEKERVTRWSAVPTMVWRLCLSPGKARFDLSSVKDIGYGGSPSSIRHQEMARQTFPGLKAISNAYGLTESGSVFAMITGDDFEARPDSVGRPFPTAEIRITDTTGLAQPAGVHGEICVKGPFLMRGFWAQPGATQATIKDGWLYTGDIGFVDEEGFLYVTDRKKDIIIRGGENISSAETENRILEHPDVSEVAVIGIHHPEFGEEVKAFVRLNDEATTSAEDIKHWVAMKLANFKVPTLIEFQIKPLPRNALGKLLKNTLRDEQAKP